MKLLIAGILFCTQLTIAQAQAPAKNVFIITLDGTRWQEIFKGADEQLLRNTDFVKDTALMIQQYWHEDVTERRRRLLPFFWSVLQQQGQLMGNRELGNRVNVANLYKISYPGYSEIFTGYPDKIFIPNLAVSNPRTNILEFVNDQPGYEGKVAAFCSWRVFPFILDEKNSDLLVNAGYEKLDVNDSTDAIINQLQDSNSGNTRHDLLTFESAKNYMMQKHPRVMYLGLGETDEFAHSAQYDTYLQKMHQADAIIADLWYYVQTDPFYKNNTTFIITTDHGRGRNAGNWRTHGFWISGSGETWMAMLGAGVKPGGELQHHGQVYQKQVAATVGSLLGFKFITNHTVAAPMSITVAPKAKVQPIIDTKVSVR